MRLMKRDTGMKRKAISLFMCTMVLSVAVPTNAYAWEHRQYTDEEVETAMHNGYLEEAGIGSGPQAAAFLYEVHQYLQRQTVPAVDAYDINTYKTFYKQVVDLSLDFLEWKDYSAFDEDPNKVLEKDGQGRIISTNFMKLVNEQKANPIIFEKVLGIYNYKELKISMRSGTYSDGKSHIYYYVRPYTKDTNSPFNVTDSNSIIDGKGWFSDIYRYAQTRDEQYLFCNGFFPDIIDQEQTDEDGNLMTYEQFVELKRREESESAARSDIFAKQYEARQKGAYKSVYINWTGEGDRMKRSTYMWYTDDSLNGDMRRWFLDSYMEDGYQKIMDALAEISEGGSVEFREDSVPVEGKILTQSVLTRIR